jgi:toxin CptA
LSVYAIVILVILLIPIVVWLRVVIVVLLLCALLYYLRRDAWLLASSSYVAIRFVGGEIILQTHDGTELLGKVLGDSLVTPILTILNVLPNGGKRVCSVVLFPDSLDSERFRELRVLLRWGIDNHY